MRLFFRNFNFFGTYFPKSPCIFGQARRHRPHTQKSEKVEARREKATPLPSCVSRLPSSGEHEGTAPTHGSPLNWLSPSCTPLVPFVAQIACSYFVSFVLFVAQIACSYFVSFVPFVAQIASSYEKGGNQISPPRCGEGSYFFAFLFLVALLCIPKDAPASAPDSLYKHDPYDISQAGVVDSADVFVTRVTPVKHLLRLPRYALLLLVNPVEKFAIYAEHAKLWARYYKFFTNKAGTFGLFPHGQLGGETGTGIGVRLFHANWFGHENTIAARYIYSGRNGQFVEGLYVAPEVLGKGLVWKLWGGYLQTRNRSANINGALRGNDARLFELEQVEIETAIEWRLREGAFASYVPQVKLAGTLGFARRDFRPVMGGSQPLSDPGSSAQARLLKGMGKAFNFYRVGLQVVYDDRDFKRPTRRLSLPVDYRYPGRMVAQFGDQFYFARDTGYPERGGFVALEGSVAIGPDRIGFYQMRAEVARYVTLFWKNRILALHARLDKVRSLGDGFVPYTELVQLGGNQSARGYRRGYFRGQGALEFNAEYRYPIWDYWNAFLFWDEGQIFDHFGALRWGGFHSSYGGGIAFRTELGLLAKVKIGRSTVERLLIGFTLRQAF